MKAVECPYCGEKNHTSAPEVLAECAYCNHSFAEIQQENQTLIVLSGQEPEAWDKAEMLMDHWQESGELEKEVIVDRRLGENDYDGVDRRRFAKSRHTLHAMIS
ncbi:MAG: hypothetical protein WC828_07390 [Thermoleophilia bacterium]|jgi:hypothetical protein